MMAERTTAPVEGDAISAAARPWFLRLSVHAAALAVVLLAVIPFLAASAPAFADEGLYSAQVAALADGSWSVQRPAVDLDPDGAATGMIGSVVDGAAAIPYARRPAYPLLLTPFYVVGGSAGLLVASVLGTWAAALCGASLARRIDRRFDLAALWLVGIGSPLLFSAYLAMGHSIAAALAGVVVLGATAVVDDRSNRWVLPTLLAAAALVLIRSEGTIMVLALCLTLAAMSVRRRPWSVERRGLALSAAVAATGAAAFIANDVAAKAVSSQLLTETGSVVDQTGPLNAVWVNLFRPWFGTGSNASARMASITVAVVLAALALRLAPRMTLLPVSLLCIAALAAVARQTERLNLVSGLVPAFPILAALLLIDVRDLRRAEIGRLALLSAVTTVGLVLTIYGELEGSQWGGFGSSRSCCPPSCHLSSWACTGAAPGCRDPKRSWPPQRS